MGGGGGSPAGSPSKDEDDLYDYDYSIDLNSGSAPGGGFGGFKPTTGRLATGQPQPGRMMTGQVPGSRMGTGMRSSMGTGMGGGGSGDLRPMTSVSGAGYVKPGAQYDPLNQKGAAPALLEKSDSGNPEDVSKEMEKKVHRLLEASAIAAAKGDNAASLEHAKEAVAFFFNPKK